MNFTKLQSTLDRKIMELKGDWDVYEMYKEDKESYDRIEKRKMKIAISAKSLVTMFETFVSMEKMASIFDFSQYKEQIIQTFDEYEMKGYKADCLRFEEVA